MLPSGWTVTRLGAVLDRTILPVDVDADATYREIGIRSHGKGIFHKPPISGKALGDKRVFWLVPDALVLNIVFAWERAVAVTSDREVGMIASHRFPMYQPKQDSCDVEYLRQFLCTPRGKELLELASPGGAGRNKTLGQKEFEKLRVLMPGADEQRRIKSILQTWDQAVVATERLLINSRNQKQALVELLVSDRKSQRTKKTKWNQTTLRQIADIFVSSVDKKSEPGEKGVRLCNYTDVYHNDCIDQRIHFMDATATDAEIEKFTLRLGDVIITKDSENPTDIAVPARVIEDVPDLVCGYHLAVVRPNLCRIDPAFLQSYFKLPQIKAYFASKANGVTRFGLPINAIEDAAFEYPDIDEQRQIARVISNAEQEIAGLVRNLALLRVQKQALQEQLLTGKRRVRPSEPPAGDST